MTRRLRNSAGRALLRASRSVLMPIRSYLTQKKRIASLVQRVLDRFPPLQAAVITLVLGNAQERYEKWTAQYDTLDESDLSAMREDQSRLDQAPLLSLIVPLAQTDERMLGGLAESLLAQVYERWEVQFVGTDRVTTVS